MVPVEDVMDLVLKMLFAVSLIIPNPSLSIIEGAIAPWENVFSKTLTTHKKKVFERF